MCFREKFAIQTCITPQTLQIRPSITTFGCGALRTQVSGLKKVNSRLPLSTSVAMRFCIAPPYALSQDNISTTKGQEFSTLRFLSSVSSNLHIYTNPCPHRKGSPMGLTEIGPALHGPKPRVLPLDYRPVAKSAFEPLTFWL